MEDTSPKPARDPAPEAPPAAPPADRAAPQPEVRAGGWKETDLKVRTRDFPVAGPVDEPVRIAFAAKACADVSSHAKESLDKEVCGVLVGEICEDAEGRWVSVQAAIRGTAAKQGGAHVTFTQETWDRIYEVKDRSHARLSILGWYHTHPGFGVVFSDMDTFIQQNYFAGPLQFALVVDPLGGDEAICVNSPEGIRYVGRYWVDGRERKCRIPTGEAGGASGGDSGDGPALSAGVEKRLQAVEERLAQLLQASEEDRASHHRWLVTLGMIVAMGFTFWIGSAIWQGLLVAPYKLPELRNWAPVAVKVGDETVMLGVGVYRWEVPDAVNAAMVEVERERQAAKEAEEARKLEEEAAKEEKQP